jgi:hypothetical protein
MISLKKIVFESLGLIRAERDGVKVSLLDLEEMFSFFHLSSVDHGDTMTFSAKVPKNPYVDHNQDTIEDDFTPRVSLAATVQEAVEALNGSSSTYFVYGIARADVNPESVKKLDLEDCPKSPKTDSYDIDFIMRDWVRSLVSEEEYEEDFHIYKKLKPSAMPDELGKQFKGCVPDADLTGEVWSTKDIQMEKLGIYFVGRPYVVASDGLKQKLDL